MQDLPKIVLNRLQEADGAEAHPDADLLTAFVERSLADSERARMLEHLALCADCRAIVTFALPATEAVTLPQPSAPAANRWFNWPVLRWGVVVAAILAVVSMGMVQHRQRQFQLKRETLASTRSAQNETVATAQVPQPSPGLFKRRPVVPQTVPQTEAQGGGRQTAARKESQASTQNTLSVGTAAPESSAMRSGGSAGGVAGGSWSGFAPKANKAKDEMTVASAARTSPPRPGPQFSVPTSSQMVEMQTAEASTVATAQSQISDQLIQNQKELPLQNRSATNLDVVKAKAPTVPEVTSSGAAAQTSSYQKSAQPLNVPQRWIISSSGALQRSFDAGTTWDDVNVNSVAEASTSKSDLVASNEKKVRKELVQPRLVFRAVTAIGSEVWAGGNGAMLYYSDDSGAHWVRVLPSSASRVFTGDVTAIEFSDPQHGSVATSYGEVWITGDKGQTWTLQP